MIHDTKPSLEDAIEHYGVKGMRWGVRKDRPGGISRKVDRHAQKDAKELVRAKAYYGEGAGTRRKLIKQTIEGRTKRYGEGYKKAVDKYAEDQDKVKAVAKAHRKRSRTDKKEATKKTTKAAARTLTGQRGNAAALVAIAVTGYTYAQSPQGRARLSRFSRDAQNSSAFRQGKRMVNDLINNSSKVEVIDVIRNRS